MFSRFTKIVLVSALGLTSFQAQADLAADIKTQINNNKAQVEGAMNDVSDNLLAVFAHRGLAPADTLGGGVFGFELGLDVSLIDLDSTKFNDVAGSDSDFDMSQVPLPKLSAGIGFPVIPLDLALTYLPEVGGFSYMSAHAKYAVLEGGAVMPAVALEANYSNASMDGALDVTTMGADVSVSKGFGVGIKFIPYAGVGYVQGTTTISGDAIPAGVDLKTDYDSSASKLFVGASVQLALINLVAQWDQIGDYQATSVKVGFRF